MAGTQHMPSDALVDGISILRVWSGVLDFTSLALVPPSVPGSDWFADPVLWGTGDGTVDAQPGHAQGWAILGVPEQHRAWQGEGATLLLEQKSCDLTGAVQPCTDNLLDGRLP